MEIFNEKYAVQAMTAEFLYPSDHYFRQGIAIDSGEPVAIKFERARGSEKTLEHELSVYRILDGGVGIPFVHSTFTTEDGDKALVMDLLGPDLESLSERYPNGLELKTVLILADQLISRVEFVHAKNLIHGNIKPNHFAMGLDPRENQVFVIDFALTTQYRDPRFGLHVKNETEITGCSIPYMSINAHENSTRSRRDDVESLGYLLLRLLKGSLPWENLDDGDEEEENEIKRMKMSIEGSFPDVPVEFFDFFKNVRSLRFEDKPDYSYLRDIFRKLFERKNFQNDYLFDWVSRRDPEEEVRKLCNDIAGKLSIQEAIPDESGGRLKPIVWALLSQEEASSDLLKRLKADRGDITMEQWRDLVQNVNSLLCAYCNLLRWLNHPTANDKGKESASAIPQRMWYYLDKALCLMRSKMRSPTSHFLYFARTAYGCFTVALDYTPQLRAAWIECLGDLSRFWMGMEANDKWARARLANIATGWYLQAADLNPEIGRIQHHLGVAAKPDALKQLFFYLKALTSVQSFPPTRETIQWFFELIPQMETYFSTCLRTMKIFVEAHGLLYRRQNDDLFIEHKKSFLREFDRDTWIYLRDFRVLSVYIVASNYAAIFDYGDEDSEMMAIFNTAKHMDNYPTQDVKSSSGRLSGASCLAFGTLYVILGFQVHRSALPSVHVSLAFLWCLAKAPRAMNQIQEYVPWKRLAIYLNRLITPDINMSELETAEFPRNDSEQIPQLGEDFVIRGFIWSQSYFPEGFFCNVEEDHELVPETPAVHKWRILRCLFAALKLAESGGGLGYNSKDHVFYTTESADGLQISLDKYC